jgi:hypothetical protein
MYFLSKLKLLLDLQIKFYQGRMMNKQLLNGVLIATVATVLIACGASIAPGPSVIDKPAPSPIQLSKETMCGDLRPDMCTQQYDPVCGTSFEPTVCKPGMSCAAVMIPKKKTYSNSCTACSNPKVQSHTKGQCPGG